MVIFPFGAVAAAATIIRRRNEEDAKPKKPKKPASTFTVTIDEDETHIEFDVIKDSHYASAAWALVRLCEMKGQAETLQNFLDNVPAEEQQKGE